MPASNVTDTANATGNTYTVKYNKNATDASGTMSNSSHTYGEAKALTANAFSRAGYKFSGWSKSSTATTATYTDKETVSNLTTTNNGTVNLYAVWTEEKYTVTVNKGTGISSVSGGGTYSYGESVTINAVVTEGYTWSKWSGTHSTTTQKYTFTMPSSNVTDTANATVNTYTITVTAGTGGTISPGTMTINYGGSQKFTISPNSGYEISNVLVDGQSMGAITNYTFSNVRNNRTISATFKLPNSAPGVPTVSVASKTTYSITVSAKATDVDGDSLTYKLYVGGVEKATAESAEEGYEVLLVAEGLSEYTEYDYYVTVTDGSETTKSSTGSVKTYCDGKCDKATAKYRDIECEDCEGSGDCCAAYDRDYNVIETYEESCSHNAEYTEKEYIARCSDHYYSTVGYYYSLTWKSSYGGCSTCKNLEEYQSHYYIDDPCTEGCKTCDGTGVSGEEKYYYCSTHGDLGSSSSHNGCSHGKTSYHD